MYLSTFALIGSLLLSHAHGSDYQLQLNDENVHWGYFSKNLAPRLTIPSGSEVLVEMATHHACDDYDKMILGDAGMESVYKWNRQTKQVAYRGATGGGDGVHILTGPIFVEGAEPGDVLKVEIMDLKPRFNPDGKVFGSNAAAWWGYQARMDQVDGTSFDAGDFTNTPGQDDELITIYEMSEAKSGKWFAIPSYQFSWPTVTDPDGVRRNYIAYPGTCVPHDNHGTTVVSKKVAKMGWTKESAIKYVDKPYRAKIPVNFHVGCMGLAPESHDFVDSIPPMPTGGNLDNKRIGVGTTMYYPVEVAGALLSMGDAHSAQGDSEMDGTGVETSLTGTFKITVIKRVDLPPELVGLDFPLGETEKEYIVHGFTETDYLEKYNANPGDIYSNSNIDAAGLNAFTQTRKFLMARYGLTEGEAWTLITQGVDFGITQVVDGNWGVHAVIPKAIFDTSITLPTHRVRAVAASIDGYEIKLSNETTHWGYFSKTVAPVITIPSGSEIVVEMATHHACDDWDKMIKGDAGMESIFMWNSTQKNEPFRGATGGGDGVHVLTGPIFVTGAEPGDILKVEILELAPRPNKEGKTYGSNAAAWWGYQARVNKADGTSFDAGDFTGAAGDANDELVTIYELHEGITPGQGFATPAYQFEWPKLTDPDGETRNYIAYPGTCVPHDPHGDTVISPDVANMGWTKAQSIKYYDDVFAGRVPINYHVGNIGLAPASHDFVDSIPPMPNGGNLDDKRIGVGTTMFYPVKVTGALLSMGDAHTAQGDSELDGTGIETSLTGRFKVTVIKKADFTAAQNVLDFPLGETKTEWIVHGFTETDYLKTYAANPGDIYSQSSLDKATMNAVAQTRKFLMAQYGMTEADAWTLTTNAVDFGITQAVDGNWGVHAVIPKNSLKLKKKRTKKNKRNNNMKKNLRH